MATTVSGTPRGAKIGAGIVPGKVGVVEVLTAGPVLHGDDRERDSEGGEDVGRDGASEAALPVDVAGELTDGEAVAGGQRHVGGVGGEVLVRDGALDLFSSDQVGAVEHDDLQGVLELGPLGCCGFEEIADYGVVGVEADS